MNDLLSIMVSRLTVGSLSKKVSVVVPYSKVIMGCLSKLYALGYISSFKVVGKSSILVIFKYIENKPVIRRVVRISKPGSRVFKRIRYIRNGFGNNIHGFFILSTNCGILTDQECFFYNRGGEVLLLVS